jgi:hypothetical protein
MWESIAPRLVSRVPAGNGGGGLFILVSSTHSDNQDATVILQGVNASSNHATAAGGGVYIGVGTSFNISGATIRFESVIMDDNTGGTSDRPTDLARAASITQSSLPLAVQVTMVGVSSSTLVLMLGKSVVPTSPSWTCPSRGTCCLKAAMVRLVEEVAFVRMLEA